MSTSRSVPREGLRGFGIEYIVLLLLYEVGCRAKQIPRPIRYLHRELI
jgi:hypothetical protein